MGSEAETHSWESGYVILEINQVENQDRLSDHDCSFIDSWLKGEARVEKF